MLRDPRWREATVVAAVPCDKRINGSIRRMDEGGRTCSLLSGAGCSPGWAELFFMFWMLPRSFLPVKVEMIWTSLCLGYVSEHEVDPPELIIGIQLTAALLCSLCSEAADDPDRQDKEGGDDKHCRSQTLCFIYGPISSAFWWQGIDSLQRGVISCHLPSPLQ